MAARSTRALLFEERDRQGDRLRAQALGALTRFLLGSAWHVNSDGFLAGLLPTADGTVEASKPVTADANKDVTGLRNITLTGTLAATTAGLRTKQAVTNVHDTASPAAAGIVRSLHLVSAARIGYFALIFV